MRSARRLCISPGARSAPLTGTSIGPYADPIARDERQDHSDDERPGERCGQRRQDRPPVAQTLFQFLLEDNQSGARSFQDPPESDDVRLTATTSSSSELTPWRSSTSSGAPAAAIRPSASITTLSHSMATSCIT